MNMVAALEKKSELTICSAVDKDPENLSEVMRVTVPAIILQQIALTPDRNAVSEKDPPGGVLATDKPSRYCFFCCSRACNSEAY